MKKLNIIVIIILLILVAIIWVGMELYERSKPTSDSSKVYISTDPEECKVINFLCVQGKEPFTDEKGCGCKDVEGLKENYCTSEQRIVDVCIEIYKPVCGWFDSSKIQCIKYPCAQTFSNECLACKDSNVAYWTEGECPK